MNIQIHPTLSKVKGLPLKLLVILYFSTGFSVFSHANAYGRILPFRRKVKVTWDHHLTNLKTFVSTMPCTKFHCSRIFASGEDFKEFSPYIGMKTVCVCHLNTKTFVPLIYRNFSLHSLETREASEETYDEN